MPIALTDFLLQYQKPHANIVLFLTDIQTKRDPVDIPIAELICNKIQDYTKSQKPHWIEQAVAFALLKAGNYKQQVTYIALQLQHILLDTVQVELHRKPDDIWIQLRTGNTCFRYELYSQPDTLSEDVSPATLRKAPEGLMPASMADEVIASRLIISKEHFVSYSSLLAHVRKNIFHFVHRILAESRDFSQPRLLELLRISERNLPPPTPNHGVTTKTYGINLLDFLRIHAPDIALAQKACVTMISKMSSLPPIMKKSVEHWNPYQSLLDEKLNLARALQIIMNLCSSGEALSFTPLSDFFHKKLQTEPAINRDTVKEVFIANHALLFHMFQIGSSLERSAYAAIELFKILPDTVQVTLTAAEGKKGFYYVSLVENNARYFYLPDINPDIVYPQLGFANFLSTCIEPLHDKKSVSCSDWTLTLTKDILITHQEVSEQLTPYVIQRINAFSVVEYLNLVARLKHHSYLEPLAPDRAQIYEYMRIALLTLKEMLKSVPLPPSTLLSRK